MTGDLAYLLSPAAIRDRARVIHERALGGGTHFRVCEEKLGDVAAFVTDVTLESYPDLKIPFHSRWGHFQAGRVDRLAELEARLAPLSADERARAKIDLVVVSVLLDAGAGRDWSYREEGSGLKFDRSEGLAVASFRMFLSGAFSSDPTRPLRADGAKLVSLGLEELARGFQVSEARLCPANHFVASPSEKGASEAAGIKSPECVAGPTPRGFLSRERSWRLLQPGAVEMIRRTEPNPLVGLAGRLGLLQELGQRLARPGELYDLLGAQAGSARSLPASAILLAVLRNLGPIWPGRIVLEGVNLGDVWEYPPLGTLIPFHKLSQWLTYSLIEPLEESGLAITGVEELTGLAEYRNGGLLLDRGLIALRDPALAARAHEPRSELVIEWRALTIALLDKLAREVRARLDKTESELPLAKVLEGGTWRAGRKAAAALRPDGSPPLRIASDGTVF